MGARNSPRQTRKGDARGQRPAPRSTKRIAESLKRELESFAPGEFIQGESRTSERPAERVPSRRRRRQRDYNWDIVVGETD